MVDPISGQGKNYEPAPPQITGHLANAVNTTQPLHLQSSPQIMQSVIVLFNAYEQYKMNPSPQNGDRLLNAWKNFTETLREALSGHHSSHGIKQDQSAEVVSKTRDLIGQMKGSGDLDFSAIAFIATSMQSDALVGSDKTKEAAKQVDDGLKSFISSGGDSTQLLAALDNLEETL